MKKVLAVLACLLLCFSMPVRASASVVPTAIVQPYYEKADNADAKLSISGTTADCESSVYGSFDVVEITAVSTLEKQGFLWIWSTYGSEWQKTSYSNTLVTSNTQTGLTSGKYRLKTVFTLKDKQGKTESITVYSSERSV